MGYVDEDGYLYLTDRSTFMIVSGGVNIYPQEAENLLVMHPKLVDAAVFGVPNEEFGEEVKAVVQPADGVAAGPRTQGPTIPDFRAHPPPPKNPPPGEIQFQTPKGPHPQPHQKTNPE